MIRIRVCLIGDFSSDYDEGLKNIAHNYADNIEHEEGMKVFRVDVNTLLNVIAPSAIIRFDPDIVHYIPGPTDRSLILLKYLRIALGGNTKFVLSSPHPMFHDIIYRILTLRLDHVFCPSKSLQTRFENLGVSATLLPNGVDLARFKPLSENDVTRLREKHCLLHDRPIILHVGHLTRKRNLSIFEEIADRFQVVIVSSQYLKKDMDTERRLKMSGCRIVSGYQPRVEEFYQMSDCYVFPVRKENTISMPLSVMEAMACNLGTVTTECEGLLSFFQEGNGLRYADTTEEMIKSIEELVRGRADTATREKVSGQSWGEVSRQAISAYKSLLPE